MVLDIGEYSWKTIRSWNSWRPMTKKRLLVVDDEPELGEFVGIVGNDLGFEVEVTRSPGEFKRAFGTFRPTTIVMDIVMPETNGVELVRWLIEQECRARVIVASGMNSVYGDCLAALASKSGISISFLNKPYRLTTLRETLELAA